MFNPSEGLASTAVVASIESAGRDRWKGQKRGRTEREKIPQGYGLYISLYIGDSFLIMPGQRRGPVHIANHLHELQEVHMCHHLQELLQGLLHGVEHKFQAQL